MLEIQHELSFAGDCFFNVRECLFIVNYKKE